MNTPPQHMYDLVIPKKRNATTTSLVVAEKFGKNHKNVIQKIEKLANEDEVNRLDFKPVTYIDHKVTEFGAMVGRTAVPQIVASRNNNRSAFKEDAMDYETAYVEAERKETETGRPHRVRALGVSREDNSVHYRVEAFEPSFPSVPTYQIEDIDLSEIEEVL